MKTTFLTWVDGPFGQISKILHFLRPYKWTVTFALLALVFTAATSLSIGQGIRLVFDNGFAGGSAEDLKTALGLLFLITILLAIGTFFRFYLMSWLGERITADIRKAVFDRLIKLHPSYFEENRMGEVMSRLTTDTTLLQSIIGSAFSMALRSLLTFVGGLIMMLVSNVKLTLIVIACIPAVLIPMFFFGKRVRKLAASSQDAVADIGSYAGEVIMNIKVVQGFTQENYERKAFEEEAENAFKVAKKRILQRAFLVVTAILVIYCAISIMLLVGGSDVIEGRLSAGELAAFVFYAIMVAMSVATIAEVYGELQRAAGASKRLLVLLSIDSQIQSPTDPLKLNGEAGVLCFEHLSFTYPARPETPVLDKIDFDIAAGKVVAIVGPSGAGKSTLFELIQRFYDPGSGSIRLQGVDIRQLDLHTLRKHIAIVPQNPILFSADVYHNIRYGNLDASEDDIVAAAKQAYAHDFIMELQDGYKTFLGESGLRLSGGQKQRIAIARAILKNASILLLDEATSALDSESELHVKNALNDIMIGRTTLIIAHRLSTVIHADKIIVMNKGRIVGSGTHTELIEHNPLYQRLCELQFSETGSDIQTASS